MNSRLVGCAVILALLLATLCNSTAVANQPQSQGENETEVAADGQEYHKHTWDDIRLLLVTVLELDDKELRWKHQTPFETRTGQWQLGREMKDSPKGIKSGRIKRGDNCIAVYCIKCSTVMWIYDPLY